MAHGNWRVELCVPDPYAKPLNGLDTSLSMLIDHKVWFYAKDLRSAKRKAIAIARKHDPKRYWRTKAWIEDKSTMPPLYIRHSKKDPACYIVLKDIM